MRKLMKINLTKIAVEGREEQEPSILHRMFLELSSTLQTFQYGTQRTKIVVIYQRLENVELSIIFLERIQVLGSLFYALLCLPLLNLIDDQIVLVTSLCIYDKNNNIAQLKLDSLTLINIKHQENYVIEKENIKQINQRFNFKDIALL